MHNILVGCSFPVFAKGLSAVMEELFAGEAEVQRSGSLAEVVEALATGNIHVLALDLHLLEGRGARTDNLGNLESMVRSHRNLNIVVMYDNADKKLFKWMFLLGIRGILRKSSSIEDIRECMKKVYGNQLYIENGLLMELIGMSQEKPKKQSTLKHKVLGAKLTKREKLVARLLLEGKSNTQICSLLKLQPSTVSTFKQHVFRKLHINSLIELEKFKQIAVL